MITEIVEINITPGSEADFEAGVAEAAPLFKAAKGCHHLRLERGMEERSRYRLLVTWESVADHMDGFRESPAFARWREIVGPFFSEPPKMEHLETALDAF